MIPNTTQVPNALFDTWLAKMSGAELKVVLAVARHTLGWVADPATGRRKETDRITVGELCAMTGLARSSVSAALVGLIDRRGLVEAFTAQGEKLRGPAARRAYGQKSHGAAEYRLTLTRSADEVAQGGGTSSRTARAVGLDRKSSTKTKEGIRKLLEPSQSQSQSQNLSVRMHENADPDALPEKAAEHRAAERCPGQRAGGVSTLERQAPAPAEHPFEPNQDSVYGVAEDSAGSPENRARWGGTAVGDRPESLTVDRQDSTIESQAHEPIEEGADDDADTPRGVRARDGRATGKRAAGGDKADQDTLPGLTVESRVPARRQTEGDRLRAEVLDHLNAVTGRTGPAAFRTATTHGGRDGIKERLAEGATVEDLKLVADHAVARLGADERMRAYIRPKTLYGPENFPGYLSAARDWEARGRPELDDPRRPALRNRLGDRPWESADEYSARVVKGGTT